MNRRPEISIIIIAYNMAREVPRTVFSFLPPFQRGIAPEDVEIIVVENVRRQNIWHRWLRRLAEHRPRLVG